MKLFSFKSAVLSMMVASSFAFMSFTNQEQVARKFGDSNQVVLVTGNVSEPGQAAIAALARAALRIAVNAVDDVLRGTCNSLLADASALFGAKAPDTALEGQKVRAKVQEMKMAEL